MVSIWVPHRDGDQPAVIQVNGNTQLVEKWKDDDSQGSSVLTSPIQSGKIVINCRESRIHRR